MHRPRSQAGFSFIEILVVMGIIAVLTSMVVVIIPRMQEQTKRTKSKDNLKNIAMMFLERSSGRTSGKWPKMDGKNFTLAPLSWDKRMRTNQRRLEVFFSPGDEDITSEYVDWKRYEECTKENLHNDVDFHELTSYAGRRNKQGDFRITSARMEDGVMILCDDDDGALHHSAGLCVAYTDGGVSFLTWEDMEMEEPDDPNDPGEFLGDEATIERLRAMSSSQ